MPLYLDIKPKSPDEEPESFDKAQDKESRGDFELEFEPESFDSAPPSAKATEGRQDKEKPEDIKPVPKIEKPQPVQKKPEPRAVEGIQKKPPEPPLETAQVKSTHPHLEWKYQGTELKKEKPKPWTIWTVLWGIIKFFLMAIIAFGIIFIATLFIVGNFYDPVPSALKAIKYAGIISGVALIYIIYLFFKRSFLVAIGYLIGMILAVGIFGIGYLYYKNDQTLPLLETLLSWFGL